MCAAKHDFTLEPGSDFQATVVLQDSDGNAQDITGAIVEMQVRETYDSNATLIDATSVGIGAEITVTGATGTIAIDVPGADTEDIIVSGVYDIQVTYLSGVIERVLEGRMVLSPSVTR